MIGSERAMHIVIAGTLLCAATGSVHAQPTTAAAATAEFDKGRDAMKKGKFAEACTAFAQSQKLDPAPGTLYNLAGCYVKIGKLTSAWLAYRELAQKDPKEARKKDSAKQAADLEPRLPKLLIAATTPPTGLVVTMNGQDVTPLVGVSNPVDLGSYTIVAKAPTYADFTATAEVTKEAETTTITLTLVHPTVAVKPVKPVPVVATKAEPAIPDDPAEERDTPPTSHRKTYAIVVGAAGVAVLATGLVFGNLASGKWSDVKKLCGDDLSCDTNQLDEGKRLSDQAHLDANLSTGLVIGGVVIAAVGGYLLFTAPAHPDRTALRLAPSVGTTTVGLSLEGGF